VVQIRVGPLPRREHTRERRVLTLDGFEGENRAERGSRGSNPSGPMSHGEYHHEQGNPCYEGSRERDEVCAARVRATWFDRTSR
jgi:hypothetical protein